MCIIKFHGERSNHCRDMAVFRFLNMTAERQRQNVKSWFWATRRGNAQGSSVARWKAHCPLPISNNWTFSLAFTAEALLSESCWNQVFSCDKEPVHRPQLVFSCQGVQIEDVKEGITLDQWLLACVCVQKNCMRACVWVYWSDNARYMTRQKRSKFTRPRY